VVGKPARAIVEYADDHDIDQIVMGSHGRSGVTRILLGSVAESVVRDSTVPVTVAR
jgi:nucleotide-binding universal stress UspA family protein